MRNIVEYARKYSSKRENLFNQDLYPERKNDLLSIFFFNYTQMAIKRIRKQFIEIEKEPPKNVISVDLKEKNDYFKWIASIYGPEGTPYEKGIFYLEISFPQDYPFKVFKMKFTTKIYHPNINDRGEISMGHETNHYCSCGENWSPALTVAKILIGL